MNLDDVIREVKAIGDTLAPMLAESSPRVLSGALASLQTQKDEAARLPRKAPRPPWRLVISPTNPLAFRTTEGDRLVNHRLEVDLACSITQPGANGLPASDHNIAVRVWSTDPAMCFRAERDAEALRDQLEARGRRVMLRFHFDLANAKQEGPRHHLQIGGKADTADYQWLPDNWKLPRFVHLPVNLVLACEFIARTFYPSTFARHSQEPTWTHAVRTAETAYLFPFLQALPYVHVDPRKHSKSLLSTVWNG